MVGIFSIQEESVRWRSERRGSGKRVFTRIFHVALRNGLRSSNFTAACISPHSNYHVLVPMVTAAALKPEITCEFIIIPI